MVVVKPDATIAVLEFVDVTVGGRENDGAVGTAETIEGVVANGFDAVNVTNITAACCITLVYNVLCSSGERK